MQSKKRTCDIAAKSEASYDSWFDDPGLLSIAAYVSNMVFHCKQGGDFENANGLRTQTNHTQDDTTFPLPIAARQDGRRVRLVPAIR